ncbi:hypothetical protein REC12_15225 [Desulfosporosinus sp. PR]|uniref:hypothetical protein n=1 Tax=Candidatus Desulfosporosinus nitrosoreducens TaxID=3401928 RepID=UPI0027E8F61C|nr:hypothetical protein [Desulfosporosinus sp. PR]MDQ7094947.1 hypothetical protein [Desulfosporosinus sp. PR]
MMEKENWAFLCGVNKEQEADIIVALLDQEGIPSLKKYPEAGGFLKIAYGLTAGVDLYVPLQLRDKALELVQEPLQTGAEDSGEPENSFRFEQEEEEEIPSPNSSKLILWGIVFAVVLLIIGRALSSRGSW